MADKENQGLLHIREVVLTPQDETTRCPQETADYPDAVQLMVAIPRDTLTRFR